MPCSCDRLVRRPYVGGRWLRRRLAHFLLGACALLQLLLVPTAEILRDARASLQHVTGEYLYDALYPEERALAEAQAVFQRCVAQYGPLACAAGP